jgi:excinuclease ABC subunit A
VLATIAETGYEYQPTEERPRESKQADRVTRRQIELQGVRVNNLKDVDLSIPHGQWLSVCGVSGSGKTSLAIDTLFAEGQRRYLESLSPGQRQFMEQLDRPDADQIDEIPPAIALRVPRGKPGKDSTVGSATDLLPYLRLLFAKLGTASCPNCETEIVPHHPESVTQFCRTLPAGTRYLVTFHLHSDAATLPEKLLSARRSGFSRAIVAATTFNLTDPDLKLPESVSANESVRIVVDRLTTETDAARIRDSVGTAFQHSSGEVYGSACEILVVNGDEPTEEVDGRSMARHRFTRKPTCQKCGFQSVVPDPKLFDRNRPNGQCDSCGGHSASDDVGGCCDGSGLSEAALGFRIGEMNFAEVVRADVGTLKQFFGDMFRSQTSSDSVAGPLVAQITDRLDFLSNVGLSYLTLDRPARTLSGGELKRISLTSILGSNLVNMLYVMDEPTTGLHIHDLPPLIESIGQLHRRKNTMVLLDHQPAMIQSAERVVEIGPRAGDEGGEIVFDGTVEQLIKSEDSLTGDFLAQRRGIVLEPERRKGRGKLKLVGASGRNLKNVTVEFPLNCLCVVSGVSGAGKTSLVQDTLYPALAKRKNVLVDDALPCDDVFGDSVVDEVVLVDQSPIGRTARSNPVTYIGAFDEIRRVFADTVDAKTHNIKVGKFSFNVAGGRCDKCKGDGQLTIDMKFMSDVHIRCDQCRGTRYRDEVLAVRHRGKNIAEVLSMTVRESFGFFRGQPKVQYKLKALIDVGLEYIQLGQPATTLSSGEAQRLKLAQYLSSTKSKRALFLMDEPTIGLHMSDIVRLADCFSTLVSVGHSLIVVEHNLQLMQYADWLIDLGPGASDEGGQIVAEGTPEDVAANPDSLTGKYLKPRLDIH